MCAVFLRAQVKQTIVWHDGLCWKFIYAYLSYICMCAEFCIDFEHHCIRCKSFKLFTATEFCMGHLFDGECTEWFFSIDILIQGVKWVMEVKDYITG